MKKHPTIGELTIKIATLQLRVNVLEAGYDELAKLHDSVARLERLELDRRERENSANAAV